MCKAAEDLYNKGREQGIEQGIEKGIEQGIEKGIEKGKLENAKAMAISMHEDGVTVELIAKYASVSVEIVRSWLGLSIA